MSWPWEVVERDHELQNPTSGDKIRLVGDYMRLDDRMRVLDVACGKGGPARILAATYGCRVHGIEIRPVFAEQAREQAAAAGLDALIEVETADAAKVQLEPDSYDAALCLGAAFVWGTIADAAAALRRFVPDGAYVAIGEPFWRVWPLPDGVDPQEFVTLPETAARFTEAGFQLTGIVAASEDDWDRYESLHWRAVEEWLADHPGGPEADAVRSMHERRRDDHLRYERALEGWAIFVGRKASESESRHVPET
jgi:SAM-dependent methyltransferase